MRYKYNGFTLIELMITLVIAAVVIGLATPSFTSLIQGNRARAMAEDFASALNYARTEALKLSSRVTICASNDGMTCGGDWTDGWIIFQDFAVNNNQDPVVTLNGVNNVFRATGRAKERSLIDLTSNNVAISFVRFTNLGALARTNGMSEVRIMFQVEGCTGRNARRLIIAPSGMVSVETVECNN